MKHLPLFVLLAACGTSDSSALLTKGMTPEFTVSTTGDGSSHVVAELFEGTQIQLIFVDLQADDELVASTGGTEMTLHHNQLLNIITYEATFSTGTPGDTFTIDLQRTLDDGAPSSTASLPSPFSIDAVPVAASRAQDLAITYGPSGTSDTIEWDAKGDCIQSASGNLPSDSGAFTIPANMLVVNGAVTSCTVTVTVSRVHAGTVDPNYRAGGHMRGEQVRTTMFTSTT